MLKQRLITAAILVPVVVLGVIWLPPVYFAVFFGAAALIGGWEWSKFIGLHVPLARFTYVVIIAGLLLAAWAYVRDSLNDVIGVLIVALLWWLIALVLVVLYPRYARIRQNPVLVGLAGILVIGPCWLALITLHGSSMQGTYLVLFLLATTAVADSGAYFGGRKWGTNKLAPNVSPGKTWEGVVSGLFSVAAFAFICAWFFNFANSGWETVMLFVGATVLTALFSVLGDLTESLYKRQSGLKDSGAILPGHGGILDRIDSITAAAPVFVICLWLLFW